jgi:hypothetical protein
VVCTLNSFTTLQESQSEASTSIRSNAELCAMINRDMNRVLAVFRLPLTLTSVFSLPEVLVVNLLMGCLCFVLDAWQLPLAAVAFCVLNGTLLGGRELTEPVDCLNFAPFPASTGAIAMSQRSYAAVNVWNDPLPLTLVGTPADPNHSSNLPLCMDPLLFLAGSVPTSVAAYPAAALAASALMQQQQQQSVDAEGEFSPIVGAQQRNSGGGSADAEGGAVRDRPTALRLLQQQNAALARVARNMGQAAHVLEVSSRALHPVP